MVFNLIDNAMKYATETSDKEIVVSCMRGAGGGVALSVRDHGPGVPREHLARIFEPFFRGEEELTRSTKGSGIGLALVKELGESMGAIVRGSNAEDGGFCVSIAFEPA
jgi:signal transduction histidine kinase